VSICPIKSTTLLYERAATEIHSSVMALHTGASLMLLPLDPDKLVRSGIDEKRLRHCHLGAVLNSKSNKTNVAASSCQGGHGTRFIYQGSRRISCIHDGCDCMVKSNSSM
jgi:hypothetical protein